MELLPIEMFVDTVARSVPRIVAVNDHDAPLGEQLDSLELLELAVAVESLTGTAVEEQRWSQLSFRDIYALYTDGAVSRAVEGVHTGHGLRH